MGSCERGANIQQMHTPRKGVGPASKGSFTPHPADTKKPVFARHGYRRQEWAQTAERSIGCPDGSI